jgi:hypothetical protein
MIFLQLSNIKKSGASSLCDRLPFDFSLHVTGDAWEFVEQVEMRHAYIRHFKFRDFP